MNLETLPLVFEGRGEVKGFTFMQVDKTDNAYLYKVHNEYTQHFEVIKRSASPVCIDFEKRIYSETEFKESYPKSNSFGLSGWTFSSLDLALQKLKEV